MKDKKLTWPQRGRLWLRLGLRLVLALLALWLLRAVGLPLLSLCAPFVAALITAALLHPPVQWLQKRLHWRRKLSSLLILLLLFGLMGGGIGYLGYAAGAELVSLVQNWEGLLEGLRTVLDQLELISFQLWTLVPPELTESVQSVADGLMDWLNTAVPNILQNAVAFTTEKAKRVPVLWPGAHHLCDGGLYADSGLSGTPGPGGPAHPRAAPPLCGPGAEYRPGRLRRLSAGGASTVGGGVFHPAGGLFPDRTVLRPAAGSGAGHAGLHPHRGGRDDHGALGLSGPVHPRLRSGHPDHADLGRDCPCSAGWASRRLWAIRRGCPPSSPW